MLLPFLTAASRGHIATEENPTSAKSSNIPPDTKRYKKVYCEPSEFGLSPGEHVLPSTENVPTGVMYMLENGESTPYVLEPDSRARGLEDDWHVGSSLSPPHYGADVLWACCGIPHFGRRLSREPSLSVGSPGYVPGRSFSVFMPRDPSAPLSVEEERLLFGNVPVVAPWRWSSGEVEGCQGDVRGEIALVLLGLFFCWWLAGDLVGFCW